MEKLIACDLECDSLETVRGEGKIHCVAFWNDDIQVCYEWGDKAIDFLAGLLIEGYTLVFHSAQYDVATLNAHTGLGITHKNFRCTQILAHAINPQLNSYSLAALTGTKLDYGEEMVAAGEFVRTSKTKTWTQEEKSRLFAIPFNPIMERYNLQDTKSTWELWKSQQVHLEKDARLRHSYETVQNPFVEVVISMHKGMHIDTHSMMQLFRDLIAANTSEYMDFLSDFPSIAKLSWDKDVKQWVPTGEVTEPNLGSPNDVASLLYRHGWNPKEFNRDTGRPSSDKATLQSLVAQESTPPPLAKIIRRMLDIRSTTGIATQCETALKAVTENKKPWIYADWHQTGTKTGRMSSSNP